MNLNLDKPIVFLDIDGVLNSTDFAISRKVKTVDQIDERAVGFLNEIADWNFVLSSSWRRFLTIEQVNNILKKKGFLGELISSTPTLHEEFSLRGNEIYGWMQDNLRSPSDFKQYVIFDDDSDMLYWQKDNFVHVDNYFGLGPNHIYRAKRMLGIFN